MRNRKPRKCKRRGCPRTVYPGGEQKPRQYCSVECRSLWSLASRLRERDRADRGVG